MMHTVVIGDIHGMLPEFQALVAKLQLGHEDRLVLVGDLMDKGPDPAGCVRYAREIGAQMVLGNHEEKHLRWRKHEDRRASDPKYKNPMKPMSPEKLAQNQALSVEDVTWLRSLPAMLRFDNWLVVHGGLLPGVPLENQYADTLVRVRWVDDGGKMLSLDPENPRQPEGSRFWTEVYDGSLNVVYGHAAHSLTEPRVDRNGLGAEVWGIDTGAAYGGRLTALVLETRQVIQVQASRAYAEAW
jgi:bis(5'-nucleosyl)-tetraphosphatase (symmetrical)